MELWDAYDVNFQKIPNVTLVRGEPIPDGCYHLVCDILVKHTDGTYLLMQRDQNKAWGGMWEATAGGSALCGETTLECAKRELREETGILADNLTELGRMLHHGHHSIYVSYLCITDCDKNSVTLQKGETQDYRWVTREEFVAIPKQEMVTVRMQVFQKDLQR